ncbi:MAG: ribbon-helix-helix protein [Aeromonas popoffii]|uniref:ribbon-helix-helix protein n=1 Tax=Aeromonas popoffii TaxID=70856 RepID=UPI003F400477
MAIPPPPARNPKALKVMSLDDAMKAPAAAKQITAREDSTLVPLNFKVSPEFKRRLKMHCVENDLTMVEYMVTTLNLNMESN